MAGRVEQIEKLLAKNPDDVFLRYSLGMEHLSAERFDQAIEAFARCQSLDSAYLPAKVERAKALRSAGRLSEARQAFAQALQAAEQANEQHQADHIRLQLESLPG